MKKCIHKLICEFEDNNLDLKKRFDVAESIARHGENAYLISKFEDKGFDLDGRTMAAIALTSTQGCDYLISKFEDKKFDVYGRIIAIKVLTSTQGCDYLISKFEDKGFDLDGRTMAAEELMSTQGCDYLISKFEDKKFDVESRLIAAKALIQTQECDYLISKFEDKKFDLDGRYVAAKVIVLVQGYDYFISKFEDKDFDFDGRVAAAITLTFVLTQGVDYFISKFEDKDFDLDGRVAAAITLTFVLTQGVDYFISKFENKDFDIGGRFAAAITLTFVPTQGVDYFISKFENKDFDIGGRVAAAITLTFVPTQGVDYFISKFENKDFDIGGRVAAAIALVYTPTQGVDYLISKLEDEDFDMGGRIIAGVSSLKFDKEYKIIQSDSINEIVSTKFLKLLCRNSQFVSYLDTLNLEQSLIFLIDKITGQLLRAYQNPLLPDSTRSVIEGFIKRNCIYKGKKEKNGEYDGKKSTEFMQNTLIGLANAIHSPDTKKSTIDNFIEDDKFKDLVEGASFCKRADGTSKKDNDLYQEIMMRSIADLQNNPLKPFHDIDYLSNAFGQIWGWIKNNRRKYIRRQEREGENVAYTFGERDKEIEEQIAPSADDMAIFTERIQLLWEAMNELTSIEKDIIKYRSNDEMTFVEIARILSQTTGEVQHDYTISRRYQAACKRLKSELKDRGF